MKPVIGITTFCEYKALKVMNSINYNYIDAVYKAGGLPVLLPTITGRYDTEGFIDAIDGIIFSGGNDISPMCYGENPIKEVISISEDRDIFEIKLYNEAIRRNMPILGICRGIQLINVAAGGTLYQDIHVQLQGILGHNQSDTLYSDLYHKVKIDKSSKLYRILSTEDIKVNSFHHQAVKDLGEGFKAVAHSYDGIIEGIENDDYRFVIGVQWHPEGLVDKHAEEMLIFESFIKEAINYKKAYNIII